MKKLLLLTALSIISSASFATHITITKQNEGPNGFDKIIEKHNCEDEHTGRHTLECSEPGYEACNWTDYDNCSASQVVGNEGQAYQSIELVAKAEAKLKQGIEQGKEILDGQIVLTWKKINGGITVDIYTHQDAKKHLKNPTNK